MVHTATTGRASERSKGGRVSAFTLIELLVVIVVVAIMAALLLPALAKTREQARGTGCRSNMKQLALAFLMYSEDNEDTFPWPGGSARAVNSPGAYAPDWCVTPSFAGMQFSPASAGLPGFGHNAECGSIYPYVTSQPRRDYDPTYKETTPVYTCPSSGVMGQALRVNYSANGWMDPGRPFGTKVVPPKGLTTTAVTDPSRKVLLVNEDPSGMDSPAFFPGALQHDVTYHLDRANIAFMDGHMESIARREFLRMRSPSYVSVYFNAGK
jgi:prepilin-type N-terminal cleavage/methylation domain-containing protein/prepilin-type processing-associated H-X9-DG protein